MIPRPYQAEMARDALEILRAHSFAYLAAEERTGKTLAAILVAEMSEATNILVLTKKKAVSGWEETLVAFPHYKNYTVTNYHQSHNIRSKFDLVILDESHNYISSFPKCGLSAAEKSQYKKLGKVNTNIYDNVKRICVRTPILYISATPHAQGPQMLYHQFSVCTWSPWRQYDNFYRWFDKYGFKYTIKLNSVEANQYDKCDVERIMKEVDKYFIKMTRKNIGFEHEPIDKVHYIELSENTKEIYNVLLADRLLETQNGFLVCDTKSKLRSALHAIEGGTYKIDEVSYISPFITEKVDYILKNFGDKESLVIMYNFQAEKQKLEEYFKKATILQATSYAEGVDLHKYDDLVIYSQDYSTARHTQRRARQCNMNRTTPIVVHHLLVKKAISEEVYICVCANKQNYVDSVFGGVKL